MSDKGPQLYRRAKRRIPGGTRLLSKRPEMFLPERWPSHVEKYRQVAAEVFAAMKDAVARGDLESRLQGPPRRRSFYRVTS